MPNTPLVTIVTPSFNQGRFIRQTIESVLSQDYPRIEYIIMDGGSTDETESVVKDYTDRVTWVSEPDRGQSHAINKGFALARGEIVTWLNSDDYLFPGAISTVVRAFVEHPESGFVYGSVTEIDEEGRLRLYHPAGQLDLWSLIYFGVDLHQAATFMQKRALETVGFLDEDLHWCMDWELFQRLARKYPGWCVDRQLAVVRTHEAQRTVSGGVARLREVVGAVRRYTGQRYPPVVRNLLICSSNEMTKRWGRARAQQLHLDPAEVSGALDLVFRALEIRHTELVQRRHDDGWAPRRVDVLLHPIGDAVEIRGRVPAVFPAGSPQRLTVECSGRRVASAPLEPGSFCVRAPVWPDADGLVHLRLRAARTFVGRRRGTSPDRRRLAYQLDDVRGVDQLVPGRPEGWFQDGWAGPSLTVETAVRGTALQFSGTVNALAIGGPQHLSIDTGGHQKQVVLEGGPFQFVVPVSSGAPTVRLRVRAHRSFTPCQLGTSDDDRRLGYRLETLRWMN